VTARMPYFRNQEDSATGEFKIPIKELNHEE
jgi:hypothetical protein